jgi:hypothetical protein
MVNRENLSVLWWSALSTNRDFENIVLIQLTGINSTTRFVQGVDPKYPLSA